MNLGKMIADAVNKQTGKEIVDTTVQEIIIADWSAPAAMRAYGFGNNFGGLAIRFDNNPAITRPITGTATLNWQQDGITGWKTGADAVSAGLPATATDVKSATVAPEGNKRFFHLQGKGADGKWGPVVHVPLLPAKEESPQK